MKRWRNITPVPDVVRKGATDFEINDVLREYDDEIENLTRQAQSHVVRAANRVDETVAGSGRSKQWKAAKKGGDTSTESFRTPKLASSKSSSLVGQTPSGDYATESDDSGNNDARDGRRDGQEDIQFLGQAKSSDIPSFDGVKRQLVRLQTQCKDFHSRLQVSSESLTAAKLKNIEMEEHIEDLEAAIDELKLQRVQSKAHEGAVVTGGRRNSLPPDLHARGDHVLRALLMEDEVEITISIDELREKGLLRWTYSILQRVGQRFMPLKQEVKQVEAQLGSSVLSYFLFYRFILVQFLALAVVVVVFSYFHLSLLVDTVPWRSLIIGTGSMPGYMYFSSYDISENLLYVVLIVTALVLLGVSIVVKIVHEDRVSKEVDAVDAGNAYRYAKEVLCCWDMSLKTPTEAKSLSGVLTQSFTFLLDGAKRAALIRARSKTTIFFLYVRRFLIITLYAGCQLVAAYVIVYFSFYADRATASFQSAPGLKTFARYVPMITFNVINQVMPTLADYATEFEQWDSGHTNLMVSLIRTYLFNTMSTLLLAVSYFLLADPFLLATSSRLRTLTPSVSSHFTCRIDQTADSIFALVLTTLGSNFMSILITPLVRHVKCWVLSMPYTKPPVDVANNLVAVLLFVGVIFLSIPFSPLALILVPVYIYCDIRWQLYWTLSLYAKPKKPWKAHKAAPVFSVFYALTFCLLCLLPCVYFLVSKTFPKNCAIQDEHVGLCADEVDSSNGNTCTTDPNSAYFREYGSSEYPAAICDYACGPFVTDSSNFAVFHDSIFYTDAGTTIWSIVFSYTYLPWVVIVCLCIVLKTRKNSLSVSRSVASSRERAYDTQLSSLAAELQRKTKMLAKYKAIDRYEVDP